MNHIGKILVLLSLFMLADLQVLAQRDSVTRPSTDERLEKAKKMVMAAQQAYDRSTNLGFRLTYYYANEGSPSQNIDSLNGEVWMKNGLSRYLIDNTETVVTKQYAIEILKEEKVMVLSPARRAGMPSPVAILDTAFAHLTGVMVTVEQDKKRDLISLKFPPGQPYSTLQMEIDPETHYFRWISYSLRTEGLVEKDQLISSGRGGQYAEKGQVKVVFSHYSKGEFSDELFDETRYFQKTGSRFEPAGRYKDYRILLAKPNL